MRLRPSASPAGNETPAPPLSKVEELHALLDELRFAVLAADTNQHVTFANRRALDLLGGSPGGRPLGELLGGDPRMTGTLHDLRPGSEQRTSFGLQRPGAPPLEIGLTLARSVTSAPSAIAFVAVFRDLAGLRELEAELRRTELQRVLGRLLAGFAHELRNPLAGLNALAEGLIGELDADDARSEYAARMLPLVERIERVVRSAVDFGQPRTPARQAVDARVIAERAITVASSTWASSSRPQLAAEPDPSPIFVDPDQVHDALSALLCNAYDATHDPDAIFVAVQRAAPDPTLGPHATVSIRVSDHGPGIASASVDQLFEPFYTTKPNRCGLGLSVAQGLLRANGGRLSVELAEGCTTFSAIFEAAEQ